MPQGAGDQRLALEALQGLLVLGQVGGEELDREAPGQPRVGGLVDGPHATFTDEPLDSIGLVEDTSHLLCVGHQLPPNPTLT